MLIIQRELYINLFIITVGIWCVDNQWFLYVQGRVSIMRGLTWSRFDLASLLSPVQWGPLKRTQDNININVLTFLCVFSIGKREVYRSHSCVAWMNPCGCEKQTTWIIQTNNHQTHKQTNKQTNKHTNKQTNKLGIIKFPRRQNNIIV